MGRHSEKRRYHTDHRNSDSSRFGVADAFHSVKRRRLSQDASEDGLPSRNDRGREDMGNDNDGWQTVSSKSSKRSQKHRQNSTKDKNAYPGLSFQYKPTKPLPLEQVRDLVLYVFADGVAPDWVAVKNSRGMRKAVVIMVPGLDLQALKRGRELVGFMQSSKRTKQSTVNDAVTNDSDHTPFTNPEELKPHAGNNAVDTGDGRFQMVNWNGLEDFHDLLASYKDGWLLNNTISVKVPGDSKYYKVHSPLQAMLIAPEPVDKSNTKNAEKRFKPVATSIDHFIHTSDELRDAEYPIHPAAFPSTADAALEMSRREQTMQSAKEGWVDSNVSDSVPMVPSASIANPQDPISKGLSIYAVDCEMVLTSDQKSSLARLSVVLWPDGKIVIDKYVKPDLPIENYFTQFSGITPAILENVTTKLPEVQQELLRLLTPSAILLGHSLESDLNALKLTHPFIIDTSMVYPHPRGLPLRSSLKFLANKYLKREIQMGGANGHDSVEDARAVLDLVKLKCEKGPRFGTPEQGGEPIFKRLGRHSRPDGKPLTSAIVEYGTSPERGLGKDATFAIGCENDEEIRHGVKRAINGDPDGREIPAGGADFVWGRLRGLEFARGWVTTSNTNTNTTAGDESHGSEESSNDVQDPSQEHVDRGILTTLRHLAAIRDVLPPATLMIVYSGTSDVRPVQKLQAMQAQYRKEFKTKKWDELTVRWTDTEEQWLRNAVEKARTGWGWVGVV